MSTSLSMLSLGVRRPLHQQVATPNTGFLDWQDEWTLHVDFMDGDHRCLLRQLYRLGQGFRDLSRNEKPCEGSAVLAELRVLATLTRRHFAREEQVMRAAAYPHLDSHRDQHRMLLAECDVLLEDARAGRIDWADPSLVPALRHWLVGHVLDDDRLLARYLRRSGMAVAAPQRSLLMPAA